MRAGFEIVFRNQPSYRPCITWIEVSVHAERIAALGELVRAYKAPATTHRMAQNRSATSPWTPHGHPGDGNAHSAPIRRLLRSA